jgi:hypothetical protein
VSAPAWLAASLGLLSGLSAMPASAAISAQIPDECGSLSEFQAQLEKRVGNAGAATPTRITLTPEGSGYRLVVDVGNQRRELQDSSCQELLRAAVVITLALLDPKAAGATTAPPGAERSAPPEQTAPSERTAPPAPPQRGAAPAPRERTTPAAAAARATPSAPSASNYSRPKFALAPAVGVHVGTLPQATPLLEFDAQLRWERFGVALGFRYLLPTSTVDERNRGIEVGAVGAYLAASFQPWPRVQTRLGLASYRLFAKGLGARDPQEGSAWELAPTLGASFTPFERPPFWTSLGLEGQLNLIRPSFEILNYDEVFRVSPVSGSAVARAGIVF